MQWSAIVAVPMRFNHKAQKDAATSYRFELPVIADGRLAYLQLKLNPHKATVSRFAAGKPAIHGHFRLIDNQWFCTWDQPGNPGLGSLRVLGGRFGLGDVIGLRPVGGALGLFSVKTVTPIADDTSKPKAVPG